MKAIGYVRVSTDKQEISPEMQAAKIMAYAVLHEIELVEIVRDEGMSAKTIATRSKALRVISSAKEGKVQAVIVYKLDRLFRNAAEALTISKELDEAGVALHSVMEHIDTKSAMGKFFFTIMAAVAEMERNIISERTTEVLRHKKALGEAYNHPPYGWKVEGGEIVKGKLKGGRFVEDEGEQAVRRSTRKLKDEGKSLQFIADTLNFAETPAKKGGKWHPATVKNVLEFVGPEVV